MDVLIKRYEELLNRFCKYLAMEYENNTSKNSIDKTLTIKNEVLKFILVVKLFIKSFNNIHLSFV